MAGQFLDIDKQSSEYTTSKFVVVPCPHEKTTSYGKGTRRGAKAILDASLYLELFDNELEFDPSQKSGIHTISSVSSEALASEITNLLNDNKIPIILGGEHSLSAGAVKATQRKYSDLTVLQFDAHADLRNEYHGNQNSHACVMRRILDICPAVQVGIRSISEKEWHFANSFSQINKIHFLSSKSQIRNSNEVPNSKFEIQKIIDQLSDNVYITFDVDVLDPSIMPSTGTPEPGGMMWDEVLEIIKAVCSKKNVVGTDFVELMPIKGLKAPDFTIAKLIYKTIGYISEKS